MFLVRIFISRISGSISLILSFIRELAIINEIFGVILPILWGSWIISMQILIINEEIGSNVVRLLRVWLPKAGIEFLNVGLSL